MERLNPLADAFLEAEDVDPSASLAIGALAVFDGPAPAFDELAEAIAGRLPLIPRYRQRLHPVPLGIAAPVWVDTEQFDLRDHLRVATVPAPAGREEVSSLVSRLMTSRMDRDRPLWEYWFLEDLPEGRWGLLSKVHHCVVDGVAGSDLYHLLLDPTPEPRPGVPDAWVPAPAPSALETLTTATRELLGAPLELTGALARAARTPRRLARTAMRTGVGLATLATALRPVHGTSLRGPLAGGRRYTWTTVGLDDVDAVRRPHDATINDVALAVVSGGFRRLLLARGEVPDRRALRALVPVSTRRAGEESVLDNRVSLMLPFLPVDVADPVERLHVVQHRIRHLRRRHEPEAGESIVEAADLGPFPPVALGVRLAWRLPQQQVAVVATNVPGPSAPLYALGRRMRQVLPYVPIADRVRIGIAMFSYCGELSFGLTADRATAPDLEVLARGITASLDELRESLTTSG